MEFFNAEMLATGVGGDLHAFEKYVDSGRVRMLLFLYSSLSDYINALITVNKETKKEIKIKSLSFQAKIFTF